MHAANVPVVAYADSDVAMLANVHALAACLRPSLRKQSQGSACPADIGPMDADAALLTIPTTKNRWIFERWQMMVASSILTRGVLDEFVAFVLKLYADPECLMVIFCMMSGERMI